jgi:hypothetical protein
MTSSTPSTDADRQTACLRNTVVITPADRTAAEPPPALTLCWHCDAVADRADPPGWVTANPGGELGLRCGYWIFPA